jgi:hypothetical protein
MDDREAARLARNTAAAWIDRRLEEGWPERIEDQGDRSKLRKALSEIVKELLLGYGHGRREPRRKRESVAFFDAPTRVQRSRELISPVNLLPADGEETVSGEDSTLRGEDTAGSFDATLPPLEEK